MRVAIFTDNDFGKVNGVTTTFKAALQWAPSDLHLRVYTAAAEAVASDNYLALRSIGVPIPFYSEMQMYVPRLGALLAHARNDRIDVVHLTTPGPMGLAALFVAWRLRLPLVGSFHTDLAAYAALLSGRPWLGDLMREYMRWPYGKCARILVPSEHTRQLLVSAKANPARIQVWPRGVDTATFNPALRSESLRRVWGVSDRRPALLYVGRVSREKGLLLLPQIAERLLEAGVDHRFVVVGDGPLLPTLRKALPGAVFTGTLCRERVAEAFASGDVFVFPSRTDTAGNVVLEAQASGLPVVVTASGGPREQVLAGTSSAVCHTDTPQEWARAIADLLRPARLPAAGAAARDYALTRTWTRAMAPLYRAYREALAPATATEPPVAFEPRRSTGVM